MNRVEEYVNRGANLLDSYMPGWFRKVNLNTLEIWSGFNCIVAQVTEGQYHLEVGNVLGLPGVAPSGDSEESKRLTKEARRHGYVSSTYCDDDTLKKEWKRVIAVRLSTPSTVTAGDSAFTVVEAVRLGRLIKEGNNTEALVMLLVAASGGDKELFRTIFE